MLHPHMSHINVQTCAPTVRCHTVSITIPLRVSRHAVFPKLCNFESSTIDSLQHLHVKGIWNCCLLSHYILGSLNTTVLSALLLSVFSTLLSYLCHSLCKILRCRTHRSSKYLPERHPPVLPSKNSPKTLFGRRCTFLSPTLWFPHRRFSRAELLDGIICANSSIALQVAINQ